MYEKAHLRCACLPSLIAAPATGGFFYARRSVLWKTVLHASVFLLCLSRIFRLCSYCIAYSRNPSTPARIRTRAARIVVIILFPFLECDQYLSAESVRKNIGKCSGQAVNVDCVHSTSPTSCSTLMPNTLAILISDSTPGCDFSFFQSLIVDAGTPEDLDTA